MSTFLQIIGAAFLGIIALTLVLIVVIVLVVRAKLKKFAGELGKMAEGMGTSDWVATPARIHLRPKESLVWENAEKAGDAVKAFQNAGFADSGCYEIEEMPGLKLQGFAHENEGLRGVIYERDPIGIWTDCVFYAADGTSVTVSNAPRGHELDHRPGHDKVYMPQADATALIFKARAEAVARTPARETASDFAARFEKAYADEMDWRNSRGGPTLDEIKRIAAEKGMEVEDEVLEAQFADTRARAIRDLEIALREKYLETSNLSAMEWEHKRQRIAFIHEKLTPEMLETYVYEWELVDDEDEELEEPIFNSTNFAPQREFVTLNQKAPDGKRFEKIGELDHPVKADVYLAPRIIREDDD